MSYKCKKYKKGAAFNIGQASDKCCGSSLRLHCVFKIYALVFFNRNSSWK